MTTDRDDIYRAARLLQWGLQPRVRPAQEPEYHELVNRYFDQPEFRVLVKEIAKGLGLQVLDVSEHGIVLAPAFDSVFAFKPADFRPASASADDRLLDGLIQLAIAATVFPRARDLEEDTSYARPPVSVDEIEENLRQLCSRIEEEHRSAPDPTTAEAESGLYEAWRVYQRRLAAMETRDDRKAQRTTRRIIEHGLERLREFGCFTKEVDGERLLYQPTWHYQMLVKEFSATTIYAQLRQVLETRGAGAPGVAN